jgi:hypothetical protein
MPGGLLAFAVFFIFRMRFAISAEAKLAHTVAAEARKVLAEFAGNAVYIDAAPTGGRDGKSLTGTGMAWDGEYLYVLDTGEVARIPLPAIRSWTWKIEGAPQTKLYGSPNLGVRLDVAADNLGEAVAARSKSGFFVTVADIKRPLWQFTTRDEAVLRRWEEILTQIDESRLKAAE